MVSWKTCFGDITFTEGIQKEKKENNLMNKDGDPTTSGRFSCSYANMTKKGRIILHVLAFGDKLDAIVFSITGQVRL